MTRHDLIRAVTGTTRLFGCIASPTDHVRAPMIFNKIFTERDINAVMVPVDIPAEQLVEGIKGLRALGNFEGAAVTIPHKLNLAVFCDELGPGAKAAAAVNAVRFTADGHLLGDNFDGHGFVAGLLGENPVGVLPEQILKNKSILIIGAGGAARSIALSLAEQPISRVDITNRTPSRAEEAVKLVQKLGSDTKVFAIKSNDIDFHAYDMVINATPLGLREEDEMPLDINLLRTDCLVCDIIMIPERTPLILAAQQTGRPVHIGRYMLDYQVDLIGKFIGAYEKTEDRT
tara:strand:- start:227 stop:1090 length:864 start_codon:yes stop_codon:yes gene_type:complete